MEIIKLNINELHEYVGNAKEHPKEQIQQIVNSIKEFGFNDPIAIDENNTIIEGHGRLYAIKELGYEEVECIRLSHLNEQQKKAYILAHNKLTMNTGFDITKLQLELDQILTLDMSLFGFDIAKEEEVEEDDFVETLPADPVVKLGDMFELGQHTLLCGDSTKPEDAKRLMDGKVADLCLTDPPYNVAYEGSNGLTIQNDNMSDDLFYKFLYEFYGNMKESLKLGGVYYIFHADIGGGVFRKALYDHGIPQRQVLIWVKNSMVLGRQDYQWKHEPILYGWTPGAGHYFTDNRSFETVIEDNININKLNTKQKTELLKKIFSDQMETTIIHEDKPTVNDVHPTMKPLKLCGRLIKNSTRPGELVVDFFGGSGSTMMACEQIGRISKLMEYDPKYAQVIVERYIKLVKSDKDVYIMRDGKKMHISKVLKVDIDE